MNWLAHFVLSPNDAEDRIGNWLGDVLQLDQVRPLGRGFAIGYARHREIDRFTDAHSLVLGCKRRFEGALRKASSVFVDVFFDHFLARDFDRLVQMDLSTFADGIEANFAPHVANLPDPAPEVVASMFAEGWLRGYGSLSGVEITLGRIRKRLSSRVACIFDPEAARGVLEQHYDAFEADFSAFWPQLTKNMKEWRPPSVRYAAAETKDTLGSI
jgi:acyl carrier protein phosphodiesterase